MTGSDPFTLFQAASLTAIKVPVLKVFDGDGFLTKIAISNLTGNPTDHGEVEATIRLGFIDAPELEQRGGREAKDFLIALIGGRNVWIDILLKTDTGKSVDRYGRVVAVAYLGDRSLARNVEIEMLLNGWAWLLEKYEPDEIYFKALKVSQRNRRGIWAWQDNIHPWAFKAQNYRDRRNEKCPAEGCVGSLVKRNGMFGVFYGCSNYPNCRYTRSI